MAKFKCNVCGYIHEGDSAPAKCPVCSQDASHFEQIGDDAKPVKKKGIDTNSNAYIIAYATALVIIVAFLLAFVSSALQKTIDANVALDVKKQVMASLLVRDFADDADAEEQYAALVKEEVTVDEEKGLIFYTCEKDGETKFVLRVKGQGLWGPIWGYVALNADKQTVYGAFFNHEGETAGLGAEIKDDKSWQAKFEGKQVFDGEKVILGVKKTVENPASEVDAVTGATLTCNGVDQMLKESIAAYKDVLNDK